MKRLEQKEGFFEAKTHNETGKKIPFFNLGPKNDWKKILDKKYQDLFNQNFSHELKELDY